MLAEHDQRIYPRYSCSTRVHIGGRGEKLSQAGEIVNISLGGCLIRLVEGARFSCSSDVAFSLRSSYLTFHAEGLALRITEGGLVVAVQFSTLRTADKIQLLELIRHLERSASS